MSGRELPDPGEEQVPMAVAGITLDPSSNMPIVILKDLGETLAIPIWIGMMEASAIATQLEGVSLSRPMTHDLLKSVLQALGGQLERIVVCDLRDNTFYALLYVKQQGRLLEVDARPSDALALALRTGASVFVARKVLERSQVLDIQEVRKILSRSSVSRSADRGDEEEEEGRDAAAQDQKDRWAEILENLKPEDFGKYKM